jgi:hypothetical protein
MYLLPCVPTEHYTTGCSTPHNTTPHIHTPHMPLYPSIRVWGDGVCMHGVLHSVQYPVTLAIYGVIYRYPEIHQPWNIHFGVDIQSCTTSWNPSITPYCVPTEHIHTEMHTPLHHYTIHAYTIHPLVPSCRGCGGVVHVLHGVLHGMQYLCYMVSGMWDIGIQRYTNLGISTSEWISRVASHVGIPIDILRYLFLRCMVALHPLVHYTTTPYIPLYPSVRVWGDGVWCIACACTATCTPTECVLEVVTPDTQPRNTYRDVCISGPTTDAHNIYTTRWCIPQVRCSVPLHL